MEENLAVATQHVPDFRLIARNPQELEAARQSLVEFFRAKIASLEDDQTFLAENLVIAQKFPIRTQPIQSRLDKVKRQIVFYTKAKAAVEAGFHIIPNFRADIFAIRTTHKSFHGDQTQGEWGRVPGVQSPVAPAGEGRYVSDRPATFHRAEYEEPTKEGKPRTQVTRWGEGLKEELDFPFALARPEVLTATQAVMADKIFDELGALPASERNADPMVVGIIKNGRKRLTFLVVWFLDTKTL